MAKDQDPLEAFTATAAQTAEQMWLAILEKRDG